MEAGGELGVMFFWYGVSAWEMEKLGEWFGVWGFFMGSE